MPDPLSPDLQEVLTGAAAKAQPGVLQTFVDPSKRVQSEPDGVDTQELVDGINTGIKMMTQDIPSFNLALPDPSKMSFMQRRGLRLARAMDPAYDQKLKAKNFELKMNAFSSVGNSLASMLSQLRARGESPFNDEMEKMLARAAGAQITFEQEQAQALDTATEIVRARGLSDAEIPGVYANILASSTKQPTSAEERQQRLADQRQKVLLRQSAAQAIKLGLSPGAFGDIAGLPEMMEGMADQVQKDKEFENRISLMDQREDILRAVNATAKQIQEMSVTYLPVEFTGRYGIKQTQLKPYYGKSWEESVRIAEERINEIIPDQMREFGINGTTSDIFDMVELESKVNAATGNATVGEPAEVE